MSGVVQSAEVGLRSGTGVDLVRVQHVDGVISRLDATTARPGDAIRWTSGFVDVHSHGGDGQSYDDATDEGIADAVRTHRARGTRHALLSLVSAPPDELAVKLERLRAPVASLPGIHGIHLEGPFLAPGRRGAHDAAGLARPTPESVDLLLEAGDGVLRQVTLAPELPGALEAVDRFVAAGIIVAVGHTEADLDVAAAAFDRGASLLTHAYNAMPAMFHRSPGPLGAALDRSHVTIEVIADGIHVHPILLRSLFAAAPGRVALVSDSMAATGLGDGSYRLGRLEVDVLDGIPTLHGTEVLAGSTLTLDRAIEVVTAAGVPVDDAIAAATVTPAAALAIDYPVMAVGTSLADIVAVDSQGRRVPVVP